MFHRVTVGVTTGFDLLILDTRRAVRAAHRNREKDIVTRQPSPTAKDALLRAASGQGAEMFDDGYALHPIARQAALATRSHWVDAFVVSASEDGWIELADLNGDSLHCWHFDDLREVLAPGTLVAVHSLYGVLATSDELLSVSLRRA